MVYSQVIQIKSLVIQYVEHSMTYLGLQSSSIDKEPDDTVCR